MIHHKKPRDGNAKSSVRARTLSLREAALLHGLEHGGAELSRGARHIHAGALQSFELGCRGALAARHNCARVAHAPPRWRRHARNERH